MQHLISTVSYLIGALLLTATFAYSAHPPGPYLELRGGASLLNEARSSDITGSYHTDYERGSFVACTVGYELGDYATRDRVGRIEIEGAYRSNKLKTIDFADSSLDAEGTISVTSAMLNSLAESRANLDYFPYVGIGIGAAQVVLENASMSGNIITDDEDVALAYQIKAGICFPTTEWLLIDVGYHYFKTSGLKFIDTQDREVETEYGSHNIALALRAKF